MMMTTIMHLFPKGSIGGGFSFRSWGLRHPPIALVAAQISIMNMLLVLMMILYISFYLFFGVSLHLQLNANKSIDVGELFEAGFVKHDWDFQRVEGWIGNRV